MTWQSYGTEAVLISFADEAEEAMAARARRWRTALEAGRVRGLREWTLGVGSLLVEMERAPAAAEIIARLEEPFLAEEPAPRRHVIPVRYDGPDLDRVAAHTGLSVAEIIARHTAPIYRVQALGFSPGFPYLSGLDEALPTPRLDSPRARVAAGSVGIGGPHTGIYSVTGPGGWNILGHTDVRLFDPAAAGEEMFLLRAGDELQFTVEGAA